MKTAITIFAHDSGEIETQVFLEHIENTLKAGVMLASATRVVAAAMRDDGKRGRRMEKQLIAAIAETYNRDLELGDLGESKSLYKR